MKFNKLLLIPILFGLASCEQTINSASIPTSSSSNNDSTGTSSTILDDRPVLDFKVLSPKGAPSVLYSSFMKKSLDKVTIAAPNSIPAEFTKGEYGAIIFDATKGANFAKKGTSKYKLASILTTGNAYLVSLGTKDVNDTISDDDVIVSFTKDAIFTKIFEKVHNVSIDHEVSDVSSALVVAKTGKVENTNVDYVILSEPMLTSLFVSYKNNDGTVLTKPTLKENITESWKKYSKEQGFNNNQGFNGFPQAGLFINVDLENDETKKGSVQSFIDVIKNNALDFENNDGNKVMETVLNDVKNNLYPEDQFGVKANLLKQITNKETNINKINNALAFNGEAYDFNAFLNEANLDGFTAYPETIFSSFYLK